MPLSIVLSVASDERPTVACMHQHDQQEWVLGQQS